MSGKYSNLELEAEHAKFLALEWVFGDTISISHNYEIDGNPAYEPLIMLKVYSDTKTISASLLELSEPPRKDIVHYGQGRADTAMQQNINNFTAQWLDRIEAQGFIPAKAALIAAEVDGVDVHFTFGADGKAIITEPKTPEKEYDLGYGFLGNGITVWNRAEE